MTGSRADRLGLVTDRRRLVAAAGRADGDATALLSAQVASAAALGLAFVQVREPDLETRALWRLVGHLMAIAAGRTRLLVNDRVDVAVARGAGVHLKHASIDAAALRPWLPTGTFVSRAVHTVADVREAGPVDALIAGTAAPTPSKPAGTPTLGPAGLAAIVAASACPVFAIGGLRADDWSWVRGSGAFGMAAIGLFLPRPGESVDGAVVRAVSAVDAVID